MVKDKINYSRTGPNTALTRQPVQGRANDGGLRELLLPPPPPAPPAAPETLLRATDFERY
jgi:hypothetical protein